MIRFWEEQDEVQIKDMIGEFLQVGLSQGGDLPPLPDNVEWFWNMGIAAAKVGEPCLVSAKGDLVQSYIQWHGVKTPLVSTLKTCHTFGSFTLPEFRGQKLVTELRYKARDIAKELGYQRLIGPVHLENSKGIGVFLMEGAKIVSVNFEMRI